MSVAYMISVEQRAIETVASVDISHSVICLNTPYFSAFVSLVVMIQGTSWLVGTVIA